MGVSLRIGTDIGGTFTDFVAIDDESGAITLEKTLTTPRDPAEGIFRGLHQLSSTLQAPLSTCSTFVHGTTLVINALIERKGAVTALLVTRGFRDVLEMRTEQRYDVYDLQIEFPAPIVPRMLRLEVSERTSAEGTVLQAPDAAEIGARVERLREAGVTSVAVCLLNGHANPANERMVGSLLAELAPEMAVSLSSDVLPRIREYERTSTTVANAYVKPLVDAYLGRIGDGLAAEAFAGDFYVMQSGGGILSAKLARELPIRIIESGPAAGVAAARWWGGLVGESQLLCFDMGGTTAKLCAVAHGEALVSDDYEAARAWKLKRGSGIPVSVPVFDLLEVGTGGGSIARIDALGLLKVGPHSSGADPGPCCYGRGGVEPTVTDADVVLGYLNPDFFLGGAMRLDSRRAEVAIGERVAPALGQLTIRDAAHGIHELANEDMASAARIHLAERGEDASRMAMVAYGGAGPVHAYGLARKLGVRRVIVPPAAGVMSALGMLVEDLAIDRVRTCRGLLSRVATGMLEEQFGAMRDEAATLLGCTPAELRVERIADLRYRGQGYDVKVALGASKLDAESIRDLFERSYETRYGRIYPDVPIELANLRLVAHRSVLMPFRPVRIPAGNGDLAGALKGRRRAWFGPRHGEIECPVFDRARLRAGDAFDGAAFVEERETTTVICPGGRFTVNDHGALVIHVG